MKNTFFPLLAILLAMAFVPCCVSCSEQGKDPVPSVDPDPQPQPEPEDGKPKPGDYTFTASELMGTWKVGDQIFVHGSYSTAARTFTLTADDISADGKTATLKLDESMFEFLAEPDYLYAAWPASAVEQEEGLLDASAVFTQPDILLTQAYLQGTDFPFDDASALISFSVSGGYDRVIISGDERPGLRLLKYENAHSSAQTSFNKFRTDGYPFREEVLGADGSLTCLWFPGRVTLKKGFTLYFGKDGNWSACYTYAGDVDVKAGRKLELGDITARLVEYNGPKPAMPEMTGNTKYAVKFNELSGICVDLSGDFLWALGDGGEICQVSLDGQLLKSAGLRTTKGSTIDSEGLSINYDTGDILISGEPNVVCRIPYESIPDIFAESKFKGVEALPAIADAKSFGNAGAEGCTYYKDGLAYIGTQTGSYLYLYDLATGEVIWRKGLREMHTVITEIAGLCYDPLTDWLWVIDSESHRFFALTGDAEKLLGYYTLKTKSNEESICVDHKNSCVWVGDDYGSTSYIYKYDFTGLDDFNTAE